MDAHHRSAATAAPPRTVLKFGGASLADGAGVRRAARILLGRGGPPPVAVVSAAGGVTARLDALASAATAGSADLSGIRLRHRSLLAQLGLDGELLDRHLAELATVLEGVRSRGRLTPEERDHVLSFGERMSARIVAAHLRREGAAATPVDAFDLGLVSDSSHGRARPLPGSSESVRLALEAVPGIPVVTGFLAADASGRLTTLGRNGSDLSAALLGEAIRAAEVQFWKAVEGVMTADPALVPEARALRSLSYAAAAEYAFRGASVLHPDALDPLRRAGIPARVLSLERPGDPGTLVCAAPQPPGPIGIACRPGLARLELDLGPLEHRAQRSAAFFAELERQGVEPALAAAGPSALTLLVPWTDELGHALSQASVPVSIARHLAEIALVGSDLHPSPALERLTAAGIDVLHARWSGPGSSVLLLVAEGDLAPAVQGLHAVLFGKN